jgi:7-cyano-7-deazaguanine synthase
MIAERCVVLLSGGLDSATVLGLARAEGRVCYALSFNYGQRHQVELECAREQAQRAGVARHLVLRVDLDAIGGSCLTERGAPVPAAELRREQIPSTYVPARNTIFLAHALAWAEVIGAQRIDLGINAVDYSGYPDCRPEFLEAFQKMARLATAAGVEGRGGVRIHAPLLYWSKAEIIRRGLACGVDYGHTNSCYDPAEDGSVCGRCDACALRAAAFAEVRVADPALP